MNKARTILVFGLIIITIIADQASKFWIRANVELGSENPIIGDYFTLHNVYNEGAFLGMGSDMNPTLKLIFLLILPVIVLALALRYLLTNKELDQWTIVGLSFVIGGGIGNIYDRFMEGKVTDFWHIDFGGVFQTGIFNVADVAVMIGMGCILVSAILNRKKSVTEEIK
jgi:signal peptidase II